MVNKTLKYSSNYFHFMGFDD